MGKSLKKESKHLEMIESLVQEHPGYMEKMEIISASFIILSSILDFWELRKSILVAVQKIIEFIIS